MNGSDWYIFWSGVGADLSLLIGVICYFFSLVTGADIGRWFARVMPRFWIRVGRAMLDSVRWELR